MIRKRHIRAGRQPAHVEVRLAAYEAASSPQGLFEQVVAVVAWGGNSLEESAQSPPVTDSENQPRVAHQRAHGSVYGVCARTRDKPIPAPDRPHAFYRIGSCSTSPSGVIGGLSVRCEVGLPSPSRAPFPSWSRMAVSSFSCRGLAPHLDHAHAGDTQTVTPNE